MLFQRWITEGRKKDLAEFWTRASTRDEESGKNYVLGPSAVVVAIQGDPDIKDGKIVLDYESPIEDIDSDIEALQVLAELVFEKVNDRLSEESQELVRSFSDDPIVDELPDTGHNYVLEFAYQLVQMKENAAWFVEHNDIDQEDELASS